jgi:GNAT superfamily N-acetyltransferase
MRSLEELKGRLEDYGAAEYIYDPDVGYIAWHHSTGENIELLFIEAAEIGTGLGISLFRRMVDHLKSRNEKPYHSVFAFRLASNKLAENFYESTGWTQVPLGQSIYAGDETVLMWITWTDLLEQVKERTNE